jgi:hypothetical protein
MTATVRHPLRSLLRHPARSIEAPHVPETSRMPHVVTKGLAILDSNPTDMPLAFGPAGTTPPASDIPTISNTPTILNPQLTQGSTISSTQAETISLSRKRAAASLPKPTREKKRQERTCRKCAHPECPGRARVGYCKNGCRDCSKVDCKGRNPKRPNKSCSEGWE